MTILRYATRTVRNLASGLWEHAASWVIRRAIATRHPSRRWTS